MAGLTLLALAGAIALALAAFKGKRDPAQRKPGKPAVVLEFTPREVVAPSLATMPSSIEFSGPLVAPQTAVVRAKAGGTLVSLVVAEGSRVKAGQPIGRIDLAEMSSRLAERSAQLESARAALAQAERTQASNQRLAEQQFISPIALEQSRAALDAARAQARAMQAQLDTARVGLRDGQVLAPIAGVVARRHALAGEKVSPEQPIVTLVDLTRLELAGMVAAHEVGRLRSGMAAQVTVEGSEQTVAGRLARIAPAAEAGTRSIGVTIEMANPEERLRAGQYALATVRLDDRTERLTVPLAAVGNSAGQDHVWLIEDGALARRAVKLGRRDEREGRVEVLEGVGPGGQVLAARFDNLREGAKAVVVPSKSPAVASAASASNVK